MMAVFKHNRLLSTAFLGHETLNISAVLAELSNLKVAHSAVADCKGGYSELVS